MAERRLRNIVCAVVAAGSTSEGSDDGDGGAARGLRLSVERLVASPSDAFALATAMLEETELVFRADGPSDGWASEEGAIRASASESPPLEGFAVESRLMGGLFGRAGFRIYRARCVLPLAPPAMHALLVSPEGYAAIDTTSASEDYGRAVEAFRWPDRPDAKLQVEHFKRVSDADPPAYTPRNGAVLNLHDRSTLSWLSYSILHRSLPGGSRFQTEMPTDGGPSSGSVRLTYALGLQLFPLPGRPDECQVKLFRFGDIGSDLGAAQARVGNATVCMSFDHTFRRIAVKAAKRRGCEDS